MYDRDLPELYYEVSKILDLANTTIFYEKALVIVESEVEPINFVKDIKRLLIQVFLATKSKQ